MAGTSREVVARALKALEDAGAVKLTATASRSRTRAAAHLA
jgi:hypothetical protein